MSNYLLSIIIPTRDRQEYLKKSLIQILDVIPNDVQVVIQDNSDIPSLYEYEVIKQHDNIKYNYINERLSFVSNFNAAIEIADGEYVCVLGDDDGVTRELYVVTKWAKQNRIEAVVPTIDFEYFYPDALKWKGEPSDGIIRLLCEKSKSKPINPKNSIVGFLKSGCIGYTYYDVVKLYHGIVRKDKLEIVKQKTGEYINGLTPDIYIAVALSLICNKVYKVHFPLTIAGVCPRSGSADSSNGRHVGKYEDAPHLIGHNNYNWSNLVPKFYSVETIWADSALAAIYDMGRQDLIRYFSSKKLTKYCHYLYGNYEKKYMDNNIKNQINEENLLYKIEIFPYGGYLKKICRRLRRLNKKLFIIHGIEDIVKANMTFDEYRHYYLKNSTTLEECFLNNTND